MQTSAIHVLIVDHDDASRRWLTEAIGRAGYMTHETSDAQSAVKTLGYWRPDLLIMNWSQPNLPNGQLLVDVRADDALLDVEVIVITADDAERERIRAYECRGR